MTTTAQIGLALARLDAWFDTMRGTDGYTGPVSHWWQNSLLYTGIGLDWRYEGIIHGYLTLHERTGNRHWLEKAQRAGDDVVAGQLSSGHLAGSALLRMQPSFGWRFAGHLIATPPVSWVASLVYDWVAANRHRLPGGTPACAMPRAE